MADQEKAWLIDYCMKSENTELALKIAEIRPDLEVAIVRSFLEKLAKSVDEELGKCSLDSQWTRGCPSHYRWDGRNPGRGMALSMTKVTKDGETTFQFRWDSTSRHWYLGVLEECEACPEADRIQPDLEALGASRGEDAKDWHWWFYPSEGHKDLGDPKDFATLRDDQARSEKIEYFTYLLAGAAEAVSKALGDVEA